MRFYNTPSVVPKTPILREIIENAGGTLVTRRPSLRHIREQRDENGKPTFVVVTCDDDLHLCEDLLNKNIGMSSLHISSPYLL